MRPQISEGFGSEWIIIHGNRADRDSVRELHGKEGVAVILFPETDLPSFLATKKLYEVFSDGDLIKERLAVIINRIEREHADIMEAGTWEK